MNKQTVNLFELGSINLETLSDGPHYILDNNNKVVGVLMNYSYYNYLERLMIKVRDRIVNLANKR